MSEPLDILLLEDSSDDAEIILAELKELPDGGPDVVWVQRLADAVDALQERTFDAALVDLDVPDSRGTDTVRDFVAAAGALPVVVLTGNRDDGVAHDALQVGAQDYLIKGHATGDSILRAVRFARERAAHQAVCLDQTRTEAALEMRQRLVNAAAHELNTPLTPILIHLDLLSDERAGPITPKQALALDTVRRNIRRLSIQVGDLIDASHAWQGDLPVSGRSTDLNEVVRSVTSLIEGIANSAEVRLEQDLGTVPTIKADQPRIEQLVYNLVDNAIENTGTGGSVTTRTKHIDGKVQFEVVDTGRGLTPEQASGLLTDQGMALPVVQNDRSGRGVGLFVSQAIVRAHAGEIWCRSDGPGKGSTFGFSLPTE